MPVTDFRLFADLDLDFDLDDQARVYLFLLDLEQILQAYALSTSSFRSRTTSRSKSTFLPGIFLNFVPFGMVTTAPNPSTTAILRAGELADMTLFYRHDLYRIANPGLATNCHGFAANLSNLLMRPIALGAQDQVGKFFSSDGGPVTVPEPSQFLEFPIVLPLPENLNYIIPIR